MTSLNYDKKDFDKWVELKKQQKKYLIKANEISNKIFDLYPSQPAKIFKDYIKLKHNYDIGYCYLDLNENEFTFGFDMGRQSRKFPADDLTIEKLVKAVEEVIIPNLDKIKTNRIKVLREELAKLETDFIE